MVTKKTSDIILGIILILASIAMLIFSSSIALYINVMLGVILVIMGAFLGYGYFRLGKYRNRNDYSFIISMLFITAGVFAIATPERSFRMIGILWGLLSVFKGIWGINSQVGRKLDGERILLPLCSSLLELVMGLILLIELSSEAMSHHVILLAVTLFADGLGMLTVGKRK